MASPTALGTQLRDIKPPVTIEDWSFYWYWSVIVLALLALGIALFFVIKLLLGLRRTNHRRETLAALKQIDWSDPKKSAYDATRFGRMLSGDDPRLQELYHQMVTELEAYKYKKQVDPLAHKAQAQFDLFVKACDESL